MDGLTGLDGGWQGAQSALRCPWSREQLPCGCQSVVAGAGAQGRGALISRPEHRTLEPLSPPLWTTKGKGEGGGWRLSWSRSGPNPPVKGHRIKRLRFGPTLCTGSLYSGSGLNSKHFCSLQKGNGTSDGCLQIEDSRHGNRLGRQRDDREIGAGT